ncbi:acyltransferase family protein [Devosia sediminis]|uniref:Acyltransferase n=1 Tax=Devosia sediminis TaxID=2798801 RepID=A0A934IW14_9HYPH|nr:acyltransferase [Devosia sediminis]MBJ3784045.1 acyltransferase [Devosia sediminis]
MREDFQSIQVLRGVAAMMVVVYHIINQPEVAGILISPFLVGGVDLFFVISGFVMVLTTGNRQKRVASAFLWRRIQRIVPLYWVALTLTLVVWSVTGSQLPTGEEILKSFLFVPYTSSLNDLLQPFLLVGWTLNLELMFYIVFALTISMRPAPQLAAIAGIFLLGVGMRVLSREQSDVIEFYGSPIILEFAAGMLIALALPQFRGFQQWHFAALAGFALLWGIVFGFFMPAPRFIGQGGFAVLLVTACLGLEPWFRQQALAFPRYLGDASYSIYLFHAVMIVASPFLMPKLPPLFYGLLLGFLCVASGLVAHRLIEKPLISFFHGRRAVLATAN